MSGSSGQRLLISRQRIHGNGGVALSVGRGRHRSEGGRSSRSIGRRISSAASTAAAATTTVARIPGSVAISTQQTTSAHRSDQQQTGTELYKTVHESDSKVLPIVSWRLAAEGGEKPNSQTVLPVSRSRGMAADDAGGNAVEFVRGETERSRPDGDDRKSMRTGESGQYVFFFGGNTQELRKNAERRYSTSVFLEFCLKTFSAFSDRAAAQPPDGECQDTVPC